MNRTVRGILITLILGFALGTGGSARAQSTKCDLIFEAIPSKDAGPIIGAEVNHALATKSFPAWQSFTDEQANTMFRLLAGAFSTQATFEQTAPGIGGFEGKSSPNALILIDIQKTGVEAGEIVTGIAAAIGYVFVQDAVVAYCSGELGEFGSTFDLYTIVPSAGFEESVTPTNFALRAYSAMVQANSDPAIGYSQFQNQVVIEVLDTAEDPTVPGQVVKTNEFFQNVFSGRVSIDIARSKKQVSAYVDNNWVRNPRGRKFLVKAETVIPNIAEQLRSAQAVYLTALWRFANPPSVE